MARILYPDDFAKQVVLFEKVKEQYDGLPPGGNPLTVFLNTQSIDLNADSAAMALATAHHSVQQEKGRMAENCTQKRDLQFGPVIKDMRAYYQFLKRLYSPNFMAIGEWGAPVTIGGRIAYPYAFGKRLTIFRRLEAKYATYVPVGSSPLDAYLTLHGQSMAAHTAAADQAEVLNNTAKQFAAQAEHATAQRNNASGPVMAHLRAIGGFLMSLYTTNPKEVGLWGFTVDDSPRAPKQVTSTVKLGQQRTVRVIVGGTLTNTGPVALAIHRGKTTTGTAIVIEPGEVWDIAKGHSIITVRNPSGTTTGRFSALRVT